MGSVDTDLATDPTHTFTFSVVVTVTEGVDEITPEFSTTALPESVEATVIVAPYAS